jgi:hypothetical protein
VILAEDLERLVVRRASLVDEIVDALLPGYQFFPLLRPPHPPGQFTLPGALQVVPQLVGSCDLGGQFSIALIGRMIGTKTYLLHRHSGTPTSRSRSCCGPARFIHCA